ncbi:Multidrug resistance-associated protein 1 [Kappamyces sp. JEL0680]|nr:Multidrug resistance-associated protein 1 [Kappamyces sp. JEL0680]
MSYVALPQERKIKYNFISYVLVTWLTPLLKEGAASPLQESQLLELPEDQMAHSLAQQWDRHSLPGQHFSLSRVVFRMIVWSLLAMALTQIAVITISIYLIPQLIHDIIIYLGSAPAAGETWLEGVLLGLFFSGLQIAEVILNNLYNSLSITIKQKLNTSLFSAVYRKVFSLTPQTRHQFPAGKIMNLVNVDCDNISGAYDVIIQVWSIPLKIGLASYFLYLNIGDTMWAALGVMIFSLSLTFFMGLFVGSFTRKYLKYADERVILIREVLMGFRIVKFRAMEQLLEARIMEKRNMQLRYLNYYILTQKLTQSFTRIAPTIATLCAFGLYAKINGRLDAAVIFPALSLIHQLISPLMQAIHMTNVISQFAVSWRRIDDLFQAESGTEQTLADESPTADAVVLDDATFRFPHDGSSYSDFCLDSVSVSIRKGELVGVVGAVGAGKSALLQALLREMPLVGGSMRVNGSVGYCSQQPWIMTGTVQDNIVFTSSLDPVRLHAVIRACGMQEDLLQFSDGLDTQIGENGFNMSGGQKSRIALARAIYSQADVFLLDGMLRCV